jgi:hypothetical protein
LIPHFYCLVMGFKTDEVVMNCVEKLREHEVYYSELSILEALWRITKNT